MRAGWNPELAKRLQRADPDARLIVEAVATEAEDVRMLVEDWQPVRADITGGVQGLPDGGVRLFRNAAAALIQSSTSDGYDSEFQSSGLSSPFNVARLAWPRGTSSSEISFIRLRLVAQLSAGQPQEVAHWKVSLKRLRRYGSLAALDTTLESQLIAPPVIVDATGGTAAGDVDFDFASTGYAPTLGDDPLSADGSGSASGPVILVVLEALKSDGTPAGNAGWAEDSVLSSAVAGAVTLSRLTLFPIEGSRDQYRLASVAPGLPRMAVFSGGYDSATIGFASAGNRITLTGLSSSTDIELVGLGDTPGGSSITYEVSADGDTWYGFADGDVVGLGSLAALARQDFYYMRATLVPGPGGIASPVLRALGARAVRRVDLDGLATVRTDGWSVDPVTLKGRMTAAEITVQRDGPTDYRDLATELVSLYFAQQLSFRLWVGHPDLPRGNWLHIDTFLIDDYDPAGGAIRFDCLSVLAQFKAALPVPNATDPDNVKREPLPITLASISSAYAQLLDAAGIAGRYLGPGIPEVAGESISKEISDSDLKSELDAVAYLAGGGIITSQGRARFVDVLGARVPVAIFPSEEIAIVQATPGLRQRIPEFFVPHSWDGDRYAQESRAFDAPSLLNIGTLGLDAPPRLEDIVAQWIHTAALADQVGTRTVQVLGPGLMLWGFRSTYAHPHLEPGDPVLLATDRFVAKDPNTGIALKGALWALGVVQAVSDPLGRDFTIWVRGYRDLFPVTQAVDRSGFPAPAAAAASDPTASITPTAAGLTSVTLQYKGVLGAGGTGPLHWRRNLQAGASDAWSLWAAYDPANPPVEVVTRFGLWSRQVQLEIKDADELVGHADYWVEGNGGGVINYPSDPADAGGGWIPNTAPIGSSGGSQAGDVVIDAQAGATADTDLTGMNTGGWINRATRKILAISRAGTQVVGGDLFQRSVDTLDSALDSPNFRKIGALFSDTSNRLVNIFRGGVTESAANLFKRGSDTLDSVVDSASYRRIAAGFSDVSNRLINVYRAGTTESVGNLFKRNVDTLDAVVDSPTYRRTTLAEADQATKPSQNLLGPGAGDEVIVSGGGFLFSQRFNVRDAGLLPGDEFSIGFYCQTEGSNSARVRLGVEYEFSTGVPIRLDTYDFTNNANYPRRVQQGLIVADSTILLRVYIQDLDGVTPVHAKQVMLNRGRLSLPFESPPLRSGRETLDHLGDGDIYRRPGIDYVDSSNRVASVYRTGTVESAGNLFKKGSDTLDSALDSPNFRKIAAGFSDASNRLVNVFRGGVTESTTSLFKRNVDTLDVVVDSSTYKRTTATEKTGAGRAAVALDTNNRLSDQRRLNQVVSANIGCLQRNLTISAVWDPTAGVDGSWKITVSAHTVTYGFGSVSYNQGIAWAAPLSTAYLYYDDPNFAGGSLALTATGAPQNLVGDGRYRVGEIVLPAEGGTPSAGTPGGSGAHPLVGA